MGVRHSGEGKVGVRAFYSNMGSNLLMALAENV